MAIEFEFNPFSVASRAARAERAGRVAEALRLYLKAGRRDKLEKCLLSSLPECSLRDALIEAAREVFQLQATALGATTAEIPARVARGASEEAEGTARILWRAAARLGAVGKANLQSLSVAESLCREAAKVDRLAAALHSAREGLVKQMLPGVSGTFDVASQEKRLRELTEAARDLEDVMDETLD